MIGEKLCANCREPFYPLREWAIYCCRDCNQEASLRRKRLAKKKGVVDPLDVLDLNEPDDDIPREPDRRGVSQVREEDRERRKEAADEQIVRAHEDKRHNPVVDKAMEILREKEQVHKPTGIAKYDPNAE